MTCRGTVMFFGSLLSKSSPSCLDTSSHVYLSMIPTSSRGIRNETRTVRHKPSFVATGFPQCSTVRTPWGLWAGRSAPNISWSHKYAKWNSNHMQNMLIRELLKIFIFYCNRAFNYSNIICWCNSSYNTIRIKLTALYNISFTYLIL